jgi:hypothetical protein
MSPPNNGQMPTAIPPSATPPTANPPNDSRPMEKPPTLIGPIAPAPSANKPPIAVCPTAIQAFTGQGSLIRHRSFLLSVANVGPAIPPRPRDHNYH